MSAAAAVRAGRADLSVSVDAEGRARVEPRAGGIDRVFGRLLGIVARAQADGTWDRLKACPWHTCHFAFYDHSRNRWWWATPPGQRSCSSAPVTRRRRTGADLTRRRGLGELRG